MARRAALAVPACMVLALAGCGGGEALGVKGERTAAATASAAPHGARQIVDAAESAVDRIHSYHLQSSGTMDHQPVEAQADVQLPGRLRISIEIGGTRAQIISIDAATYLNANLAYWQAQGADPRVATLLAGHWLLVGAAAKRTLGGLSGFAALTRRATAGLCAIGPSFGSMAVVGRASVHGRAAVVIALAGNAPGSFRGSLYVAANGSPLPLREVQTSPNKPGGTTVCGPLSAPATQDAGTQDFTRFNAPVSISAPTDVLNERPVVGGIPG